MLNRTICKFVKCFNEILEKEVSATMVEQKDIVMEPTRITMDDELVSVYVMKEWKHGYVYLYTIEPLFFAVLPP